MASHRQLFLVSLGKVGCCPHCHSSFLVAYKVNI